MLALRKNMSAFVAILALMGIGIGVGAYILAEQGARFPVLSEDTVRMYATLDEVQGLTPGQNQTVQVAGVEIGKITDAELVDGRARLELAIEKQYVEEGLIREDARALLRPRTPLKDLYLQLLPGSREVPAAGEDHRIPLQNTLGDVELDEILSELDVRTRDYLTLLIDGAGTGLRERGSDLAEVFERFGPTARDLARVNRALAQERLALRRAVSSFAGLTGKLAERPEDLSRLVATANATFAAIASEDGRLRETLTELPGTLRQTTTTLTSVGPLARELGPVTRALVPAVRALERANAEVQPLGREAEPIVRRDIRPFVRAARPVVRDLAPAAEGLAAATPELRRASTVLNSLFNMLAFNPDGREAPREGREEGYLFWFAWTAHQGANLINIDDANGPMRPIFLTGTCTTLASLVRLLPELEFGMALSPLLAGLCDDPDTSAARGGGR